MVAESGPRESFRSCQSVDAASPTASECMSGHAKDQMQVGLYSWVDDLGEIDSCTPTVCEAVSHRRSIQELLDKNCTFRHLQGNLPAAPDEPVEILGFRDVWTKDHLCVEQLLPLRQQGDPPMDAVVSAVKLSPKDDFVRVLRKEAAQDPQSPCALFLNSVSHPPDWVKWSHVDLGQHVFQRYLPLIGVVLFHGSLVGGFSAPLITRVLEHSGYLTGTPLATLRRLFDTFHMLVETCCQRGSLRPDREGWEATVRVRALHARVRKRLMGRSGWRVEEWGVPINQEDNAATLLAFSYVVLWLLEVIRGVPLTSAEQEAYLHLWRYMGWLLGVAEENNPCRRDLNFAKAQMGSFFVHLFTPDASSQRLAHHMLRAPAYAHLGDKGQSTAAEQATRTACVAADVSAERVDGQGSCSGDGKGAQRVCGRSGAEDRPRRKRRTRCDRLQSAGAEDLLKRADPKEPKDNSACAADRLLGSLGPSIMPTQASSSQPSWREAAAYRRYVFNSSITRLLVGDVLGDALQLPFDVPQRRAAKRFLLFFRFYGWLCALPYVGACLAIWHKSLLQVIQLTHRTPRFVLHGENARDATREGSCPFSFPDGAMDR